VRFRDGLAVALAAVFVMAVAAAFLNPTRLHVDAGGMLNDQVGYIAVARNLVGTGRLESNLIYPAILSQKKSRTYLYMPGYYVVLATSYALFGFGVCQSVLPSVAGFVVSAVLVYLIGARLYDRRTGFLAAGLFMTFPANLLFAWTAMSESVVVTATLVAVAAFIAVPTRWRASAGPILLVLPFLFRETAVFLILPLMALVAREDDGWQRRAPFVLVVGTLVLLSAVYCLDFSAGRPALNRMHIDAGTGLAKYTDATVPPWPPTLANWLQEVATNVAHNGPRLVGVFSSASALERVALAILMMLPLVVVAYGMIVWRRDLFPLAVGLMAVCVMAAVMSLYSPHGFRAVRMTLFTYPLLVVCGARCAARFDGRRWSLRSRLALRGAVCLGLAGWLGISLYVLSRTGRALHVADAADDAALEFMNAVHHDDRRMLVAPFWMALPYVFSHHPVHWAFVPKNRPTLDILSQQYDIETLVMPADGQWTDLSVGDLEGIGLRLERRL
jgi:hypothetical protein